MAQITDFVTGFSGPIGMALNGNDLYVVDIVASKIVKIDLTATPPTATDVVTGSKANRSKKCWRIPSRNTTIRF